MTPKDKAENIIDRFQIELPIDFRDAKVCALIAVDEIIEQWHYIDTYLSNYGGKLDIHYKYWLEVKNEIENYEHTKI